MTIKTKRASRSVPAEHTDGKRLLIVLKPSSAWRQGIPYDKPHIPELAPDDTLFDKYKKTIKSHKWTEEEWISVYRRANKGIEWKAIRT